MKPREMGTVLCLCLCLCVFSRMRRAALATRRGGDILFGGIREQGQAGPQLSYATVILRVLWGPNSTPPPASMALPGPSSRLSWLFPFLVLPPSPCRLPAVDMCSVAGDPVTNPSKLASSKTLHCSRPALMLTSNQVRSRDSTFHQPFPQTGLEELRVSCLHEGCSSHPKGHFYQVYAPSHPLQCSSLA